MTLTGLKTTQKEIAEIRELLPRPPTAEDEATARFMAKFTAREIIKIGNILARADNGEEPTEAEMAFLQEMADRPAPPLAPIVQGQPICRLCKKQPASERRLDFGTLCDDCFDAAGGNFDITKLRRDTRGNYIA
jgi:hypothetical protein